MGFLWRECSWPAKQVKRFNLQCKYPWDGQIKITLDPDQSEVFSLNVRIPGWAQGRPVPGDLYKYLDSTVAPVGLKVNGKAEALKLKHGFASIERRWKQGDVVELSLPMPVRRVVAHEAVKDDAGLVAIERGPIVYCLEGSDNKDVFRLVLPDEAKLVAEPRGDLLGGVTVIQGEGRLAVQDAAGKILTQPAQMLAIPYYAWCNRGPTPMNVWLARTADKVQPLPATANLKSEK